MKKGMEIVHPSDGELSSRPLRTLSLLPRAEADFIWWWITTPAMRSVFAEVPLNTPRPDLQGGPLPGRLPYPGRPLWLHRCPVCPYMETGARPGGDPAAGPAVPGAKLLWDSGFSLEDFLPAFASAW
jgi:hypothetical protein